MKMAMPTISDVEGKRIALKMGRIAAVVPAYGAAAPALFASLDLSGPSAHPHSGQRRLPTTAEGMMASKYTKSRQQEKSTGLRPKLTRSLSTNNMQPRTLQTLSS